MPTHATLRLEDNALLCPTPRLRRAITRSIARIGRDGGLVGWALPDNHGHLAIDGTPEEANHLAWRIELALQAYRPVGAGPFQHRWLRTDDDFSYLRNMTDYILRQSQHHGTTSDPFAESDCRLDILGLRAIAPWVRPRVRERLPRLKDESVAELLGLDLAELRSWATPLEPTDGLDHLAEATLAVYSLGSLKGNAPWVARARAAAVLACDSTLRAGAVASTLGISVEAMRRIRRGERAAAHPFLPDPFNHPEVRAVAAQARWRAKRAASVVTVLAG